MTDCKLTSCIQIQFAKHLKDECKRAHKQLNDSHSLVDMSAIFMDDARTALKKDCVETIWNKTIKQSKECTAEENQEETSVSSCFLGLSHLTQGSLTGSAVR